MTSTHFLRKLFKVKTGNNEDSKFRKLENRDIERLKDCEVGKFEKLGKMGWDIQRLEDSETGKFKVRKIRGLEYSKIQTFEDSKIEIGEH